ncbi:HAD family hydrolase, partial [Candidatus Dojkabacteria bacterium]|nr:HAD family hydrolase [Candidatus Dojkabacteria bacterium]
MQDSFTRLGIQRVLFDLDDTLLETHNVFIEVLGSIRQRIAVLLNVSLEQLERDFEECQLESRKLHHVNPLPLWTLTLENLGLRYPVLDAELQQEFVQTIMQELYTKPIVLKEGALELVLTLIEAGIPIGIVTNASDEWTKFKLEQSGLTN